jgi:hypothetical protein
MFLFSLAPLRVDLIMKIRRTPKRRTIPIILIAFRI